MAPFHEVEIFSKGSTTNGNSIYKPNINNNDSTNIDLSTRMQVKRSPIAFNSFAESLVDLPAGALFAPIVGSTCASEVAYSTLQTGLDTHVELNSDLLYCNHSCTPSLEFDVNRMQVRVSRRRALRKGDTLTFWYPSTEWDMAQPFRCSCEAPVAEGERWRCKGWISGAKDMDDVILREYWLNDHIERLLAEHKPSSRDRVAAGVTNGKEADKADDGQTTPSAAANGTTHA